MKIIFIVGQQCQQEPLNDVVNSLKEIPRDNIGVIYLPEQHAGPDGVVDQLTHAMISCQHDGGAIIMYTRYSDALNFIGSCIDDKLISTDDVRVIARFDDRRLEYSFTNEGYLGPNWEIGSLGANHQNYLPLLHAAFDDTPLSDQELNGELTDDELTGDMPESEQYGHHGNPTP